MMASFGTSVLCFVAFVALLAVYFRDTFDPASIRGKRVVITGSSTGIGEHLAYEYSKLGARVLITARRGEVLQKVVAKCKELGAEEAFYIPLDMGRLNDTDALIKEAVKRFGALDHLVLNHISSNYLELWNGDWDKYHKVMNVNLRAYVSLATNAVPLLAKSGGSIAVVSSVAGKVGVPFSALYCSSKFGLSGFFNAFRLELQLKKMNVSISEFIIGSINTPNAIKFINGVYNEDLFSTSAADTAYRIMTGTQERERIIYFPRSINTPNAIKFNKGVFDEDLFSTSAADTAYRIMTGTQERERIVYFPRYTFAMTAFRDLCPSLIDWLLISSINEEAKEIYTAPTEM